MIKFNKNGQGEEKLLLNMNCRFMLLITKMENHRLIFQFVLRSPRVKNKITVNAKQIVNLWSLEKEDKKDIKEKDFKEKRENKVKEAIQKEKDIKEEKVCKS